MRRIDNPPNPYLSTYHEWIEEPPPALPEVYEERAKSILNENDSPDLGFRWSGNPYRGCQHACAYCYARPTHEYLGWGAGTDFETKLIVKINAPQLLREAFRSRRWKGEAIEFSGATDCYQPLEAVWKLTRRCLEVCVEFNNPVGVATKSYLVCRDADLLGELARGPGAHVCMSIPFADDKVCRLIEPQAPPPSKRFDAMRKLADAGVPVGVLIAPIIPGLNDRDIGRIVARAAACGATYAGHQALRLPGSVEPVFFKRLRDAMPLAADRIENRLREIRGGRLNDPRFFARMTGRGPYWDSVEQLLAAACRKHGFEDRPCRTDRECASRGAANEDESEGAERQMTFAFAAITRPGSREPHPAAAEDPPEFGR